MIRRPVPSGAYIVKGAVPVVSFGNPARAAVATLGINPSSSEFLDRNKQPLPEALRRLATLDSLGASSTEDLTDDQIAEVVAGCNGYFHRNPYTKWFDPLDGILEGGLGVSYFDGSAAHLDLVQWATDPVWGNIPDQGVREQLLEEGSEFLRQQLERENVSLVVVNGLGVWNQLTKLGLIRVISEDTLVYGRRKTTAKARVAEGCGARFVGWTCNIQHSRSGFRGEEDRPVFARWLRDVVEGPRGRTDVEPSAVSEAEHKGSIADLGEHLERTVVGSKAELVTLLGNWLRASDAETIGSAGTFGGKWLIRITFGGGNSVVLNADTKRAAVEVFLAEVNARGVDIPWRILPNNRGTLNKVDFLRSGPPVAGWYCYLEQPATEEGTL